MILPNLFFNRNSVLTIVLILAFLSTFVQAQIPTMNFEVIKEIHILGLQESNKELLLGFI